MNIVLASDENYLLAAETLIRSLVINNHCECSIYLLYADLNRQQLDSFASAVCRLSDRLSLQFIKINDSLFENVPAVVGLPRTTYYRFLLPEVLPIDVDRALYLDCDIIINKPIEAFYHMDFNDKLFVVCEDIGVSVQHKYEFLTIYGRMNKPLCNGKYFNAGVMLFNMELARQMIDMKKVKSMIDTYRPYIFFMDQDILNFLYGPYTLYADYRLYNLGVGYLKEEEAAEAVKEAAIIHYYGHPDVKPWLDRKRENSSSFATRLWWNYLEKSP
ncbi:MAG: glycosyltransferase family 8 protein [Lachnospiraceae bacterium]|nr:glycosyltransferase family 8 protein [Lachnospiraceae bacterium]